MYILLKIWTSDKTLHLKLVFICPKLVAKRDSNISFWTFLISFFWIVQKAFSQGWLIKNRSTGNLWLWYISYQHYLLPRSNRLDVRKRSPLRAPTKTKQSKRVEFIVNQVCRRFSISNFLSALISPGALY